MRYRKYRRDKKAVKQERLAKISEFSGYPPPAYKIKVEEGGDRSFSDGNDYDYLKRYGRGKKSKYLKQQYARSFRSGKRKFELYKGSGYKRASGDFWWDFC